MMLSRQSMDILWRVKMSEDPDFMMTDRIPLSAMHVRGAFWLRTHSKWGPMGNTDLHKFTEAATEELAEKYPILKSELVLAKLQEDNDE